MDRGPIQLWSLRIRAPYNRLFEKNKMRNMGALFDGIEIFLYQKYPSYR